MKKSKKLPEVPMMEENLAIKLHDAVAKRIIDHFVVRAGSDTVNRTIRAKCSGEIMLAITDVFAIVPDGYKKRGK